MDGNNGSEIQTWHESEYPHDYFSWKINWNIRIGDSHQTMGHNIMIVFSTLIPMYFQTIISLEFFLQIRIWHIQLLWNSWKLQAWVAFVNYLTIQGTDAGAVLAVFSNISLALQKGMRESGVVEVNTLCQILGGTSEGVTDNSSILIVSGRGVSSLQRQL